MRKCLALLGFVALAGSAAAQTPDPREHNFTFSVEGAGIGGVVGYRIEFAPGSAESRGSRRLDVPYVPTQRSLFLTVNQKGLSQLQDWLNSATDAQAPVGHTVTIVAKDSSGGMLASWELAGVTPVTFSSTAAGTISEVDATIQFSYDRLRLVQARSR